MNSIGIMQGRLSPPTDGKFQSFPKYSWKEEFYKAEKCGLKSIEWIFELDESEKNPISTSDGIEEISRISKETNIIIESICADYFMNVPYLKADPSEREDLTNKLIWLVQRADEIGAKYIDLPFVDNSSIGGNNNFKAVIEFIEPVIPAAEEYGVIIALETDLGPEDFKSLLLSFNHPNIAANYDTGNSSGIGYNCREELRAYGKWIRTIHIKDRLLNNGTKPLGTGSADFDAFFYELTYLDYSGPVILQAAREPDEVETAIKNRLIVENYLTKFNIVL